jgi:hypothetical protein
MEQDTEDTADGKGPLLDPATRESLHILCDLIELQASKKPVERIAATGNDRAAGEDRNHRE